MKCCKLDWIIYLIYLVSKTSYHKLVKVSIGTCSKFYFLQFFSMENSQYLFQHTSKSDIYLWESVREDLRKYHLRDFLLIMWMMQWSTYAWTSLNIIKYIWPKIPKLSIKPELYTWCQYHWIDHNFMHKTLYHINPYKHPHPAPLSCE